MSDMDNLDRLYVVWAFLFQVVLIVHFAVRKRFLESYTMKYGWIVYALCIPAAVISILLLLGDFVMQIQFRNPLRLSIVIPYVLLYLSTVMFYWWPLARLGRPLWVTGGILFVIATILNITSH